MIAAEGHKARLPKQRHWLNHHWKKDLKHQNITKLEKREDDAVVLSLVI
jgi:hypothetical protein